MSLTPRRNLRNAPLLLAAIAMVGAAPTFAEARRVEPPGSNDPKAGRQWAVLIGCEGYQKVSRLIHTVNDARRIAKTLRERGGFPAECVAEFTDEGADARSRPLKASLTEELPKWFARPGADDSLVVFFSGHGFRDKAGRLYLAPLDFDKNSPAATGIPVEWLRRQISECKARSKFLILDACHAGSEKGEDDDPDAIPAKDLNRAFQGMEDVITLASSTADEKSQIWMEKQQSLYSYWVNQGLKGHADENGNGVVDVDEISKYVFENVTRTAKARFPLPQTPVRIVRVGVHGSPAVVRLRPQTLKGLLGAIAEQLAADMEERDLGRVGVLEFTCQKGRAEYLGRDYGNLGLWCAEEVEKKLSSEGRGKFVVANHRRLLEALEKKKFAIRDLGRPQALKDLSDELDGLPVLAQGTLRGRAGNVISLQCQLIRTDSDEVAGVAGGTAELSVDDWAMLGLSAEVPNDAMTPEMPSPDRPARPPAARVIEEVDRKAKGPHPLADPAFPFPVRIVVDGKARPMIRSGNEMLVPLRAGEVYAVDIENRTKLPIRMRMLVDGLDTLPHALSAKGVQAEAWAQRTSLRDARVWLLDRPTCRVSGFATRTGELGETAKFTVVRADKVSGDRQEFTDQNGLITIAFYDPPSAAGSRGPLATVGGEAIRERLVERGTSEVGNFRAVIHIRYVDADDLERQP